MTTLRDIVKYLKDIAPQEFTFHGRESRVEVGPQTQRDQAKTTINRATIATYASAKVVANASQSKANLLVTHRPLFPFAVDRLTGLDLIRARLLAKNYISSYVIGSAWIGVKGGLSDSLVESLDLSNEREFMTYGDYNQIVPIGRECELPSAMNHSRLVNYVAEKLNIDTVLFAGDLDGDVGRILVSPGFYIDMPEILSAKQQDIGTIITGELSPEIRLLAHEENLNTIELGAFVSEAPGMKRLRHQLSLEIPELNVEFVESAPLAKALRPYSEDMK
jgi:putative NIF3 family GTP cyclohydrolase 1 type 2